jgi:protein deglycase
MSRALVPLADGFEEVEAVTVIDLLRRGGVEVVSAGLAPGPVTGSHGLTIAPDASLDTVFEQDFDMVVLPGGMPGAKHLAADARVIALLKRMAGAGRTTAAICAAPSVLAKAGLLANKRATSYPGFLKPDSAPGLALSVEAVVEDGEVITSRGPGTAMDFALALLERLEGKGTRQSVEEGLQRTSAAPGGVR